VSIIINVQQGSPEWYAARVGLVTASRISDLLAKGRGSEESASRANYRAQIIAERLTGQSCEDRFESAVMARAKEQELFARAAYEVHINDFVEQVGIVLHPTVERSGASPDLLVGNVGGAEIKCPNTSTHIDTMIRGTVPTKYLPQIQWQMACTGRAWWDFVSFDNRLPEDLRLFVLRVTRDDVFIQKTEAAVRIFNAEVDEYIDALKRKAVVNG